MSPTKKEYELTDAQFLRLVEASHHPVWITYGHTPLDRLRKVWFELGDEVGFAWDTAEPILGKHAQHFTAEPLEDKA